MSYSTDHLELLNFTLISPLVFIWGQISSVVRMFYASICLYLFINAEKIFAWINFDPNKHWLTTLFRKNYILPQAWLDPSSKVQTNWNLWHNSESMKRFKAIKRNVNVGPPSSCNCFDRKSEQHKQTSKISKALPKISLKSKHNKIRDCLAIKPSNTKKITEFGRRLDAVVSPPSKYERAIFTGVEKDPGWKLVFGLQGEVTKDLVHNPCLQVISGRGHCS